MKNINNNINNNIKIIVLLLILLLTISFSMPVYASKVCPDGYSKKDEFTCIDKFGLEYKLDVIGIESTAVASKYINGTRTRDNLLVDTSYITVNDNNIDDILNTPKVNETLKVYDFANLLTVSEELLLYTQIETFMSRTDYDCIVLTIDDNNKGTAMKYSDDFYDYNYFGKGKEHSGILFLIDMDTSEIYINTVGLAISKYDPYIDTIIDNGFNDLKNGKYFSCLTKMIDIAESIYDNPSNYKANVKGETSLSTIFAIAIVVTFIVGFIIYRKNRLTIRAVNIANYYLLPTSKINYNHIFRNVSVTKTKISSDSGSSSGGSHTSGGGISQGGGGRHF